MKDSLEGFTIAVTGDFGPQRSHEKMQQWVEANGGTFAFNITPEVTHLICSREHFKKKVDIVREACKIPGLFIVSFDWLEDSLMNMYPQNEAGYLLHRRIQAAAKAKKAKKAVRRGKIRKAVKAFEKSCREFRKDMFSNGYHIYRDSTTFAYDVTLARTNLVSNKNERYHLKLYESHTAPSLYTTYVKYSSPGTPLATLILAPIGSSFDTALFAFTKFFALKTKREWALRLLPPEEEGEDGEEGDAGKAFAYTPPEEGEPRGVMLQLSF